MLLNQSQMKTQIQARIRDPNIVTWINDWIDILSPKDYVLCDGTDEQYSTFCSQMVREGRMIKLNEDLYDNCYLCRSDPNDVARTEDRTFICTSDKNDAGITNNWMSPIKAKETLTSLMIGCMKGRTMYIIPFCMGDPMSPIAQYGIQLTDSLYVAIGMKIMARPINFDSVSNLTNLTNFIKCVHSVGSPLSLNDIEVVWPCNSEKYICHFPETLEITSYGSGYGGNALLGKKCLALRLASYIGQKQGWLAEHMLILKMTKINEINDSNEIDESIYIAAAFPSACGKTNLAMIQSDSPNWKIECIGDDIAWLYPKTTKDGTEKLYAINPENGFFGVLPGTSDKTNPTVMRMIKKNTIFTNVGLTPNLDVWWEGKTSKPPNNTIRWDGSIYTDNIDSNPEPAKKIAHPNSRFTTPCSNCDILASEYYDPHGVPISAIIFGGRRTDTIPLVTEAKDWNQGVLYGATLSSETTAAATGKVGVIRNDPFAMLPFCGYNMRDYFNHWINMGKIICGVKFYLVNWFRKDSNGSYIWPGFKHNIHVLKWIYHRNAMINCRSYDKNIIVANKNVISTNKHVIATPFGITPIFDETLLNEIYPEGIPSEINSLFNMNEQECSNETLRIKEFLNKFPGNDIIFDASIRSNKTKYNNNY